MFGSEQGQAMAPRVQFTAEQQEQITKIHEKYNDERVEKHNRLAVLATELGDIMKADEPDFGKIERKMEEMSGVRLELQKIQLRQHKEVRGLLDDDQRTLFDRSFAARMGRFGRMGITAPGAGHPNMRGGMGRGAGTCQPMGRRAPGAGAGAMMQGGMGMGPCGGQFRQTAPEPSPLEE